MKPIRVWLVAGIVLMLIGCLRSWPGYPGPKIPNTYTVHCRGKKGVATSGSRTVQVRLLEARCAYLRHEG